MNNETSDGGATVPCISLLAARDECAMPLIPLECTCLKCGLPAPVLSSDSLHYTDPLGYSMHRIRVLVKCENCKEIQGYRLGGYVIKGGEFVKANNSVTGTRDAGGE